MTNTPYRQKILVDFRSKVKTNLKKSSFNTVKGVFVNGDFSVVNPEVYITNDNYVTLYSKSSTSALPSLPLTSFLNCMYPVYLIQMHHPEYLL